MSPKLDGEADGLETQGSVAVRVPRPPAGEPGGADGAKSEGFVQNSLLLGGGQPVAPFGPSADWMRPTQLRSAVCFTAVR